MEEFSSERQIFSGSFRRQETPLEFAVVRELIAEDITVRQSVTVGSRPARLKGLRATHHKLAQVLASGFSNAEASLTTGYSGATISILLSDPTFQELLAFYKEKSTEVFVDVQQRMAGFATDAVEVLQERLAESPEKFTNKDLNDLIKTTADRGGHSPVTKTENKNINISSEDLLRMKQEVEQRQNGTVRRINQNEESSRVKEVLRPKLSESPEPLLGGNDNRPAGDVQQEAKVTGSESEGPDL